MPFTDMMRAFNRQGRTLILLISCLLLPTLVECIKGPRKDRKKFAQERQVESYIMSRAFSHYQDCVDDLYASDLNGNLKLTEDEYVVFISKRSHGRIEVDGYVELPFSLISTFVYGSCFCSYTSQTPFCCVGRDAGIGLNPDKSPYIEDNLITICRTVDEAIMNKIGTFEPSKSATNSPTFEPTYHKTMEPSAVPSVSPAPSHAPSKDVKPTKPPSDTLCLNFQYGLVNDEGFTSDDLENEIGNSYRSGLLNATRNITIQVLNETLSKDPEGRDLKKAAVNRGQSQTIHSGLTVVNLGRFHLDENYSPRWEDTVSTSGVENKERQWRRRTAYLPSIWTSRIGTMNNRRLAFYTDIYPPVINFIVDSAFCPDSDAGNICSVVDASVCVVLENGDNKKDVKETLMLGIERLFIDGSFEGAIPPEDHLDGRKNDALL
mmetsp:Transcript_6738/g.15303  ORF Transcript_6738/g.15303 Transcript_6738/m.15303 type:complete len:434 (+) Transcript_6738:193-1494(+)